MARVAIGSFQHATNTFVPSQATVVDFARAGGWPVSTPGLALFDAADGANLPMTGFFQSAQVAEHELAPLLWCAATPSSAVEATACERIAASRRKVLCPDS